MSEIGESVIPNSPNMDEYVHKGEVGKIVSSRLNEVKQKLQPQPSTMGGMQQFDPNEINGIVQQQVAAQLEKIHQEQARKKDEEMHAQNQDYLKKAGAEIQHKIDSSKDEFPDIDEVLSNFDYDAYGHLVFHANDYPDTAAIIHDLATNPDKAAKLALQFQTSPKTAIAQFDKLAKSVSDNLTAKRNHNPSEEPVSRLKSSNIGVDAKRDPSKLSVSDFRKMPFNRG